MHSQYPSANETQLVRCTRDGIEDITELCRFSWYRRLVAELNGDPAWLRAVRRNHAREAAFRHDWLRRIQLVFDALSLAPSEEMRARDQYLDQIASQT